jgi:hypothetical protein
MQKTSDHDSRFGGLSNLWEFPDRPSGLHPSHRRFAVYVPRPIDGGVFLRSGRCGTAEG